MRSRSETQSYRLSSSKGGVLWESISDKQLPQYLMSRTEEVYNSGDQDKFKKAALIIRRQPKTDICAGRKITGI